MNCIYAEIKADLSADNAKDGTGAWNRLRIGECLDIGDAD
jgi:hypothetical protein